MLLSLLAPPLAPLLPNTHAHPRKRTHAHAHCTTLPSQAEVLDSELILPEFVEALAHLSATEFTLRRAWRQRKAREAEEAKKAAAEAEAAAAAAAAAAAEAEGEGEGGDGKVGDDGKAGEGAEAGGKEGEGGDGAGDEGVAEGAEGDSSAGLTVAVVSEDDLDPARIPLFSFISLMDALVISEEA